MDKQTVIAHFGSPRQTATALGITQQAVGQWPDTLTDRVQDRIIAALARRGEAVPASWLVKPITDQAEPTGAADGAQAAQPASHPITAIVPNWGQTLHRLATALADEQIDHAARHKAGNERAA